MSKKSSQEIASSDIYRSRRHLDKIYHETISKRSQSKYKNSRKKALETIEKNAYTQDLASYLDQVHKTFKRLNRVNPDSKGRQEEYLLEKICEKCVTIKSDELLLLCDICDDAYHTYCLDPPLQELPPEDESWVCPLCVEQQAKQGATVKEEPMDVENSENNNPNSYGKRERQSRLEEHFEMKQASVKMCFECKEEIQEVHKMASLENIGKNHKPAKIKSYEMCIKCQHLFHPKCFNTNKNTILCEKCQGCVTETMPHNESTILDFFNVALKNGNTQMSEENENSNCSSIQRLNSPIRKSRISKAKRKSSKVSLQRKKLKFRLPKISEEPEIALGRKKSLAYALLSKDIVFDDDLCFSNPECPPSCNNAQLEPNLQKMDKTNAEIFHEFKSMTRKGDYPPVMIQEDKNQGFVVKADEDIPRLTLLAEYVGEVDFARQRLFDRNDSIMDLLRTSHSTTSLVICPEKRGNLARFISGINNFDQKAKIHKQNVKSIRYNIDGHARVFLYAEKVIKKDDVLYYDYNEGGFNDYPTEEFV